MGGIARRCWGRYVMVWLDDGLWGVWSGWMDGPMDALAQSMGREGLSWGMGGMCLGSCACVKT